MIYRAFFAMTMLICVIGLVSTGFIINNRISKAEAPDIFPAKVYQYSVMIFTDHKDTNGIIFRQNLRILTNPDSPSAYRAVLSEVDKSIVMIPLTDGSYLFVPRTSIRGFKVSRTDKVYGTHPSTTHRTDYSMEIPEGPVTRLDKMLKSGTIQ